MPEIWLKYGPTDVVLDIKFDNLSSQVSSAFQPMPEEQAKAALDAVPATDNMLVLALSPSRAVTKAVMALADAARARGFGITVDVPARFAGAQRTQLTALAGGEVVAINRAEYPSLQERLSRFQSAVAVSSAAFDPLFGFSGAATAILRNFMPEKMSEAFSARRDNLPAPGEELGPAKVALESTDGIGCSCIELVANGSGIAGVHSGSIRESFGRAAEQLRSISTAEEEPAKCLVASASGEPGIQTTLASSLNSLWNNIHMVKEGGTAILLAECRDGLGGGALQMQAEGRLDPAQIATDQYVEGAEHLMFAGELRQKCELGLVSSLPKYYSSSRLGFTPYAGMSDVLARMPEKFGKSYRALVLSDSDITLLRPRI